MRIKRYFEQVASGGGAFGFFFAGRGEGVGPGSNLGWNRHCTFYCFWAFFPWVCAGKWEPGVSNSTSTICLCNHSTCTCNVWVCLIICILYC